MIRFPFFAFLLFPLLAAAQQPSPQGPPPSPTPPAAAPAPAPKEEARKIEKIEVQGDGLAERRESTASKIIVNAAEITKYGDTNLLEVLKRLPGITVDSAPGGRGGAVRMRGLATGYTQILVNGEAMPPGFTLDSISPDMIERIEIVRGATAEFSTQAVAGTINVVLKRAPSQRKREMKAGLTTSHGKSGGNVSGQWADKEGPVSWTVPFQVSTFSFPNDGTTDQRVFDPGMRLLQEYRTVLGGSGGGANGNIAPRVSWALGANSTLNLDAFALVAHFHGHFTEDYATLAGPPPPYVVTDFHNLNDQRSFRVNGQWVRRWADGARIDAKLGLTRFDLSQDFILDADDASGARTLERTVRYDFDDNGLTTIGKYTFPITRGHALSVGWDGAANSRHDVRRKQDANPVTGTVAHLDEDFQTGIGRLALFGQDEWDVTERFAAYAGVRWEAIETRSDGNTFDAIRNRSSVASPIVNLLWKLPGTEKDQVRMGLARTYKPPVITELIPRRFFAVNNTATTPDFIGNPNLKPELSWGLDAAFEHYPVGGGNASVSFYYRRISDVIQRQVFLEDGLYVATPSNIGKATVKGIEVDAKGKLSQLVEGAPGVDLRANFAVNRSTVDFLPGPFNRLNEQVPWNGTLGADYRFQSLPLTLGSSFTARAGGTVRSSQSQVNYRGVTRNLDTFVLWRFSPAVQVRFTVQDVLAQHGTTVSTYSDENGVVERSSIDPHYRRFAILWEVKL